MRPETPPAIEAALGLGGNLGDVPGAMRGALRLLAAAPGVSVERVSSLYRTAPWGPIAQPPFLNAAALIDTSLAPHALLDLCLAAEAEAGRVRAERYGPRTLDIDILLFGPLELADARLTVPHPRLAERAFALVPLAEIAPHLRLGASTVMEAALRLDRSGVERLISDPRQWPPDLE